MAAASILSLFSCCLQRKPTSSSSGSPYFDTGPNEHSHLIPATADPTPTSPSSYVVDHQRMKERMSRIVRAKEGKMVNVTARLPFNLHNRSHPHSHSYTHARKSQAKFSTHASTPSTSPSRSASASTSTSASASASGSRSARNRPSLNFTPYSASGAASVQGHVGAPLVSSSLATPVSASASGGRGRGGGTEGGPSRSSSRVSRDTSLLHGDGDGHESDLEGEREREESGWVHRRGAAPILNVRLVRGAPLFAPSPSPSAGAGKAVVRDRALIGGEKRLVGDVQAQAGTSIAARRGRAKRREADDLGLDQHQDAGPEHPSLSPPSSSSPSSSPSLSSPPPPPLSQTQTQTKSDTDIDRDADAGGGAEGVHPTLCISPASTASAGGGFRIQDAGPLVVSWGD